MQEADQQREGLGHVLGLHRNALAPRAQNALRHGAPRQLQQHIERAERGSCGQASVPSSAVSVMQGLKGMGACCGRRTAPRTPAAVPL